MAHTMKVKRHFAGQLGAHIDRLRGHDQRYGNENIDPSRTRLNYDLCGCDTPLTQLVQEAIDAAPRTVRKDAVVLGATVVTLPRDWPAGRDPRGFFEAVRAFDLAFWPDSYREARATVHMDETTPHMHHVFIPLDAKGQPNFNGTYTRRLYQRYHAELQKWVCDTCGLPTLHVLLDDDDVAGKALSALPQADYVRAKRAEADAAARAEAAEARAARAESRERVAARNASQSRREAEEATRRAEDAQKAAEAAEAAKIASEDAVRAAVRARDIVEGDRTYRQGGVTHRGLAALRADRDELERDLVAARQELSEVRLKVDEERSRLYELRTKVDQLRAFVKEFLADVWEVVMSAWDDHGPWAQEQDAEEVDKAVGEVSRTWGIPTR